MMWRMLAIHDGSTVHVVVGEGENVARCRRDRRGNRV